MKGPRAQKKPFQRVTEKSRPRKVRSGPGRYFVLTPDGTELAHFQEFSGYGGAKEYIDVRCNDLPIGTEAIRRSDGVVMAYISRSSDFASVA